MTAPAAGARTGAPASVRVYRIPHSTNVVRVALAAALKGVTVEWIDVDPADRSELVRVSGQPLVPVLVVGDGPVGAPGVELLTDSPRILYWLEQRFPEPPLLPADPHQRAAVEVFCDWFNRVWKGPPNAIEAEEAKAAAGGLVDAAAIAGWSAELRASLDLVEGLLGGGGAGAGFLFGDRITLADVTAWPFLLYAVLGVPADDAERFHHILVEHLPLGDGYPLLRAWVERVAALREGQIALASRFCG